MSSFSAMILFLLYTASCSNSVITAAASSSTGTSFCSSRFAAFCSSSSTSFQGRPCTIDRKTTIRPTYTDHSQSNCVRNNIKHNNDINRNIRITTNPRSSIFMSMPSSSSTDGPILTQVISDVDDTIKSSGGVNVAGVALGGIDVQYKRGDIYPGVTQFYLELSLSTSGSSARNTVAANNDDNGSQEESSSSDDDGTLLPPKVAILTARASELKIALEVKETSKIAQAFRFTGEDMGIQNWGIGPVLYGSIAEWIIQYKKGLRKFTNFERLIQQDPTGSILQYIYVGDTGELDMEAGETMLREYPEVVKAIFLHYVKDTPGDVATWEIPPTKYINGRPVVFFRTYVGAALAALQLELITPDGLQRVIDASRRKLANVSQTSDKWIDLQRDIRRANEVLYP